MNKNSWVWIIVIFTFILLGFPVFYFGIYKSFFISVDPDVVYLTNALLYTKYAIISYADHPGTPSIMILYWLLIPFRLYAKYVIHTNFIQWSFDNYAFLTYSARILMLAIYSYAILIFVKLAMAISKSIYVVIFAWISILAFAGAEYATFIGPEVFSIFLSVVWLVIFWRFLNRPSLISNLVLAGIAGFALANKFTNLTLVLTSICLPAYLGRLKFVSKIASSLVDLFVASLGFYIGIWPAIMQLNYIKRWVEALVFRTGGYGSGGVGIFQPGTYFSSLINLVGTTPLTFVYVLVTVCLAIYLLIKKKIGLGNPIILLLSFAVVGVLVFAKYPVIHYSYVNIVLIISCLMYFLTKVGKTFIKYSLLIVAVIFVSNLAIYLRTTIGSLENGTSETVNTVLARWTPLWSSDIFREQLDAVKKP